MTTYETDNVKLYLGDCLDILPTLAAGSIDAVVTDPPYGISGGKGGDARDYGKGDYDTALWADTEEYIMEHVIPIIRRLIESYPAAVTPGNRCMHFYPRPTDIGCFWHPATITHGPWGFTTFTPILYYGKDWRAGRGAWPSGKQVTERAEKNGHPCPKPIGAWTWLVEKVCPPDGTILDPFMGSGTTGVACIQTGRKFIGIEIDPGYFELAKQRILDSDNKVAINRVSPRVAQQEERAKQICLF
jgi:site-specific DNA-methyltransferase (adenine-specific)/modification methylase